VLCFDVEPDEAEVEMEPRPWVGFERLVERIGPLREQLTQATGRPARFNWFVRMDPQIAASHGDPGWAADRYGDRLSALREAGDTIGLHPHAWRRAADPGRWVADHGNPDWVDHCIRVSYETYAAVLGEPCRAQRSGDMFVTERTVRLAAQLGCRFDLTVEPGSPARDSLHVGAAATGRIPDQTRAPRGPYRPSVRDALRPADPERPEDDGGLWMIPLTAIDWSPFLPPWRRLARRVRHPLGVRHRTATLFGPRGGETFWRILERDLSAMARPYLAFAVRSDMPLRPDLDGSVEEKLAALVASPLVRKLEFTTPEAVVPRVEEPTV
jgi:hypothetical protein